MCCVNFLVTLTQYHVKKYSVKICHCFCITYMLIMRKRLITFYIAVNEFEIMKIAEFELEIRHLDHTDR